MDCNQNECLLGLLFKLCLMCPLILWQVGSLHDSASEYKHPSFQNSYAFQLTNQQLLLSAGYVHVAGKNRKWKIEYKLTLLK